MLMRSSRKYCTYVRWVPEEILQKVLTNDETIKAKTENDEAKKRSNNNVCFDKKLRPKVNKLSRVITS